MLGCKDKNPEPYVSRSKYVTFRLDKKRNSGFDFKIILTAFTDGKEIVWKVVYL